MNSDIFDTEYVILENIYTSSGIKPSIKQRDLAQIARTSLGMTNSILKRMAQKGWITLKKINSRNIHYAITMEGFNEIIKRSYGYFKRTIKDVALYKESIDSLLQSAVENGINTVLLIGTSDLEFIIEHICNYHGLSFLKSIDRHFLSGNLGSNTLVFFAENIPASQDIPVKKSVFLSQLLLKIPSAS